VAASHNEFPIIDVGDSLDGWPSRFADPGAPEDRAIRNLIVVSGIDKNSRVSMRNPYASWLAMAPGYQVNVADGRPTRGFGVDTGASLGTDPASSSYFALMTPWY